MHDEELAIKPYKIGDKIKVYLGNKEGEFNATFGVVAKIDNNNTPTVTYKDFSQLSLRQFDRFVEWKHVVLEGYFEPCFVLPCSAKKELVNA